VPVLVHGVHLAPQIRRAQETADVLGASWVADGCTQRDLLLAASGAVLHLSPRGPIGSLAREWRASTRLDAEPVRRPAVRAAVTELCEQRADCCELGGGVHQPLSNRQRTLAHGALGPRVNQRLSLACRPLQERRVQLAHVLGGDVENAARVRGRPPQIIQQRERDLRPSAAGALCTRIGRIERKRLDRVTSEFDVDHETLQRISLRTRDPEASSTSEVPGRGIRRRHHRLAHIVGARLTETTREHARTSADGEGSLALQFARWNVVPPARDLVPAPDVHPVSALRVGIRECVRQPIEGEISGQRPDAETQRRV